MKESRTLPGPRFWTGSLQKGEGDNLLEMKPPTLWCFMMAALDADTPPEPTHPSSELYGDLCFCCWSSSKRQEASLQAVPQTVSLLCCGLPSGFQPTTRPAAHCSKPTSLTLPTASASDMAPRPFPQQARSGPSLGPRSWSPCLSCLSPR